MQTALGNVACGAQKKYTEYITDRGYDDIRWSNLGNTIDKTRNTQVVKFNFILG